MMSQLMNTMECIYCRMYSFRMREKKKPKKTQRKTLLLISFLLLLLMEGLLSPKYKELTSTEFSQEIIISVQVLS